MATITDYHKLIRDAVVATIEAAVPPPGMPVLAVDDIEDITRVTALPAIAVACIGPEQNRAEMTTNAQDGLGLPVVVMLLAVGVANAEKSPELTDITAFRRQIRTLFNNQRLAGVSQVGWCEVSDSGPIIDKNSPAFQRLSTALVVNAVGRFPRT